MRIPVSVILFDLYSSCGILGEEAFDILSDLRRTEEKNHYGTILRENFPRGIPSLYSNLNKNYLVRRNQARYNFNKSTENFRKGLEKRVERKEIKEIRVLNKMLKEEKIKYAFKKNSQKRNDSKRKPLRIRTRN